MIWIFFFWAGSSLAQAAETTVIPVPQMAPMPIFLRQGFSSVLEFDESPTQAVLGDAQSFQVERLERSLVLRALSAYATTNLFVYFKSSAPMLFVLTASEEAEPTYFKRLGAPKAPAPVVAKPTAVTGKSKLVSQVTSARFDDKKDYLTVEVRLAATAALLKPKWELVRLKYQSAAIAPQKLWSERKEVQKDSAIQARFIFAKPNIPKDLSSVTLVVPIEGQLNSITLRLKGGA